MTDEERIDRLERDLSFLARFTRLSLKGHATLREHERFMEIESRYDRFTEEPREEVTS